MYNDVFSVPLNDCFAAYGIVFVLLNAAGACVSKITLGGLGFYLLIGRAFC